MSGWYYIKPGLLGDETIGPITDQEFLKLAYDGKFKPQTAVSHPHHTNGQWATVAQIPAAQGKLNQGNLDRRQAKEATANEASRLKAEKKEAAEQSKQARLIAIEAEREAELAERRARFSEAARLEAERSRHAEQLMRQQATQAPVAGQFRCPFCQSTATPYQRSEISTAGWVLFIVLLLFLCLPLCWIGLLIRNTSTHCGHCHMKLS